MKPADMVTDALAVARVVHLAQQDDVWPVRELREAYEAKTDGTRWQELSRCPYCLSPYVAVLVLLARRFAPRPWGVVAKVLAASYLAGRMESL